MARDIDTVRLVAHELRAPLAVIKGYLALLSDGTFPIPDETREGVVDVVTAKTVELDNLIDRLLLGSSSGDLLDDVVDASTIVKQAIGRLKARARLEDADVFYSLPKDPVPVRAHGEHVARILDNLFNNALDYSERPARVVVEVRAGAIVEIAVRDRGRGIPEDERDAVFLPFVRGGGSRSGGMGIGLAISRELARQNRGELVLRESGVGQGSTFVLRLPGAMGIA